MRTASERILRPALALRVGICGARQLTVASQQRVARQLQETFGAIRENIDRLGSGANLQEIYDLRKLPMPALHFLSPLARGSDRLGAVAALAHGFSLRGATPFPGRRVSERLQGP